MRTYNWREWKVPNTPCNMIGKNYREMEMVRGKLMDIYPNYEFKLEAITQATWQMMYSE